VQEKNKRRGRSSQITQTAKRSGDPAESGRAGRGLFTTKGTKKHEGEKTGERVKEKA